MRPVPPYLMTQATQYNLSAQQPLSQLISVDCSGIVAQLIPISCNGTNWGEPEQAPHRW